MSNKASKLFRKLSNQCDLSKDSWVIAPWHISDEKPTVDSSADPILICSYSWMLHSLNEPGIHVPGAPRKWNPPDVPFQVYKSTKSSFIDENGHRARQFPFEPLMQATSLMNPDFKFDDVDIVCDRNTLRRLLPWGKCQTTDPFAVDLVVIGKTMFMCRKEHMTIGSGNGFGNEFENRATTSLLGLQRASSHHRVHMYKFGNLNIMVRHEVDAFHEDEAAYNNTDSQMISAYQPPKGLTTFQINRESTHAHKTILHPGGRVIDWKQIGEIKSTGIGKSASPGQYMEQLWFSRTPLLFVGRHQNGNFEDLKATKVDGMWKDWEQRHQPELASLAALLQVTRDQVVTKMGGRAIMANLSACGQIQLYEPKRIQLAIPMEMVNRFWTERILKAPVANLISQQIQYNAAITGYHGVPGNHQLPMGYHLIQGPATSKEVEMAIQQIRWRVQMSIEQSQLAQQQPTDPPAPGLLRPLGLPPVQAEEQGTPTLEEDDNMDLYEDPRPSSF
ncbi:hypothetical protein BU24DRAFT_474013 [Aaosphaeria arxii CBS 175.79]|uniref:Geranylgeranyl pyrophosphate synthetase n=1 Tax=Aaosphaeria arxii CBS 175.79 TaxID=1450172 RepID=A0A6A5X7Y1_9PLEO|nr:uncharacterized protein BU24DRAFT_474013 [Aaosphaeria arxii CBS 175.79]KAF2009145.1 hypothetical protein BU24DRAFT_474013 [Aaosphaeria arxii CBS 175.79]